MAKSVHSVEAASDAYDDLLTTVALRLKQARQKMNLTQKEVAEKAGLKQSYIFELESGRTNITLRTLGKMAEVLSVDARDFFPEGQLRSDSFATLAMLTGVLEKITIALQEREEQETKRQAQDRELLAELRSFTALRNFLERDAKSVQESLGEKTPQKPGRRNSKLG
jgi:transcriptional regulator with XRE-family HTH domain